MRMRKLEEGQSVVFLGSREVQQKLLRCNDKTEEQEINVADVLVWAVSETQSYTRRCVPLWATQGMRHLSHNLAWSESSGGPKSAFPLSLAKTLLESEAKNLHSRYHVSTEPQHGSNVAVDPLLLDKRADQVHDIQAKCLHFETASLDSALLQEEQERELFPENEHERQVERPPAMKPREHRLHEDVVCFATQGNVNRSSDAFQPAFETLEHTSASHLLEPGAWPEDLLVTTDFARTVQCKKDDQLDSFLRPVHWILCNADAESVHFAIISPHEAHELLPLIRAGGKATLHNYSPRVNYFTRTLEHLSFCITPALRQSGSLSSGIRLLNLFSGQLYLKSYQEYLDLCLFLGLGSSPLDKQIQVSLDGFVRPKHRSKISAVMGDKCPFQKSPVGLLQRLFALRRKDLSFAKSHLGKILQGNLLTYVDFQAQGHGQGQD